MDDPDNSPHGIRYEYIEQCPEDLQVEDEVLRIALLAERNGIPAAISKKSHNSLSMQFGKLSDAAALYAQAYGDREGEYGLTIAFSGKAHKEAWLGGATYFLEQARITNDFFHSGEKRLTAVFKSSLEFGTFIMAYNTRLIDNALAGKVTFGQTPIYAQ